MSTNTLTSSYHYNSLIGLSLPNSLTRDYDYDDAGQLLKLTHSQRVETLTNYDYALDDVGNRRILTESLTTIPNLPPGTYLETQGQVIMEAENGDVRNPSVNVLGFSQLNGFLQGEFRQDADLSTDRQKILASHPQD